MGFLKDLFQNVYHAVIGTGRRYLTTFLLLIIHPIIGPHALVRRRDNQAAKVGFDPMFFVFLSSFLFVIYFIGCQTSLEPLCYQVSFDILRDIIHAGKPVPHLFILAATTIVFVGILFSFLFLARRVIGFLCFFNRPNPVAPDYREIATWFARRRTPAFIRNSGPPVWVKKRWSALPYTFALSLFLVVVLVPLLKSTPGFGIATRWLLQLTVQYDQPLFVILLPFDGFEWIEFPVNTGLIMMFAFTSPVLVAPFYPLARLLLFPNRVVRKGHFLHFITSYVFALVLYFVFFAAIFISTAVIEWLSEGIAPPAKITDLHCDFSDTKNPKFYFALHNPTSKNINFGSDDFKITVKIDRNQQGSGIQNEYTIYASVRSENSNDFSEIHSVFPGNSKWIKLAKRQGAQPGYEKFLQDEDRASFQCGVDLDDFKKETIADTFGPWFQSPRNGKVRFCIPGRD